MTVNEKKRGRPRAKQTQLSADVVLGMAKSLMKSEGKVPSIRLLAKELNVDPMAIYHYFKNKNTLLESLTSSLVEEIYQPSQNADWQQELFQLSVSYIELLREYRGLLTTMLSMKSGGPAHVFTSRYLALIRPLELSEKIEKDCLDLLADYLHGFALSISCCEDQTLIKTDMIKGPMSLIVASLEASKSK